MRRKARKEYRKAKEQKEELEKKNKTVERERKEEKERGGGWMIFLFYSNKRGSIRAALRGGGMEVKVMPGV